ncbi:Multiple antibiotic resistance protein MarR [compost metagenome]
MMKQTLGQALKKMRILAGLSQRELAKRLGVHQPQIAKAEADNDMLLSRLQSMADAVDCEVMLIPRALANDTAQRIDLQSTQGPREVSAQTPRTPDALLASAYEREWPDIDPHIFLVIANIQRAAEILDRSTERLASRHGLSSGEILVLGALRRLSPPYSCPLSQLRKQFWISLPGMSKRISNLQRLGLVERKDNPDDGRGVLVSLTSKGLYVLEEQVTSPSVEFTILRDMPANELHSLSEQLSKLLTAFDAQQHKK